MERETLKLLEQMKDIPTVEVLKDLSETRREITRLEEQATHLEATPFHSPDVKLNHFRAKGMRSGIEERKIFAQALEKILDARRQAGEEIPLDIPF